MINQNMKHATESTHLPLPISSILCQHISLSCLVFVKDTALLQARNGMARPVNHDSHIRELSVDTGILSFCVFSTKCNHIFIMTSYSKIFLGG